MRGNKIVSLFSGIDAFGVGFNDFDIALHVEVEKHPCAVLEANKEKYFPGSTIWNRDIYSVKDEEILQWKDATGIIGGPMCQAFSPAKGAFDPNDPRVQGIFEYLRWVRLIQPEFFVMENTAGLAQKNKRFFLDRFIEEAESLGYEVSTEVMNSHHYGNAQNRLRLIAVGVRRDCDWRFSFPSPIPEENRIYAGSIFREDEHDEPCMPFSERRQFLISLVPEGGNWRDVDEVYQREILGANFEKREGGMTGILRRVHRLKPLPTLVTSPVQRNTMLGHFFENRPLNLNEYKRGQGLPEDFILNGPLGAMYKAVGNAVPVQLARAINNAIVESRASTSHLKQPLINLQFEIEDNGQLTLF
ncbi:DNA cytosine methyltransferase [Niallia taxi]|uniref:DNA cytosine methyltransferase n=1 Tax=Niallia taxi TaxID=2499688 RepID=UPI0015F40A9D|nr:DNA cytosine methyltransferase [Niallia taxi]